MPSIKRSVGIKSSIGKRTLLHLPNATTCFPEDEFTRALHSSWIRRLRLRPLPKSAEPSQIHAPALDDPSPLPAAPVPSARTTRSEDPHHHVLDPGHRNMISTGQSRTPASVSNLHSAFLCRRLNFCRERSDHGGNDDGDGCRSFAGFGPYRVKKGRGIILQAAAAGSSSVPPPPWRRLPTVDPDHLGHDPESNYDGFGGFGFAWQDSAGDLDKPNYANFRNMRKEEECKKTESRRGIVGVVRENYQLHDKRNFVDGGTDLRSFQRRRSSAADDHHGVHPSPFFQFRLPLFAQDALNPHDYLRGSRPSSFVRSLSHPWPVGNESRCSPSSRLPLFARDLNYNVDHQRMYEQHLFGYPSHGTGNMNGAKYISRTRGGGAYQDIVDDSTACGTFLGPLIHHNSVLQHERQAPGCPNEPDEAFSYWNMGRYKRTKAVSSSFPSSSAFPEQK